MLGLDAHIYMAQHGLSRVSLDHLKENTGLSYSFLANCLPINLQALQRYASQQRFSQSISERELMIADVYAKGYETFEDRVACRAWMKSPVPALGGQPPEQLLPSAYSIQLLLQEPGSIEHGIFA